MVTCAQKRGGSKGAGAPDLGRTDGARLSLLSTARPLRHTGHGPSRAAVLGSLPHLLTLPCSVDRVPVVGAQAWWCRSLHGTFGTPHSPAMLDETETPLSCLEVTHQ